MMERSLARSRQDDTPEILPRRIQMFTERTIPILEYYDRRHKLLTIDGEQPIDLVEQEILQNLKSSS